MRPTPITALPQPRAACALLWLVLLLAQGWIWPAASQAGTAPAAPTSLNIYTYPTPTSIELDWISNSTNESSFDVERKVDGQPDSAFTPVGSADPVDSSGTRVYFTDPTGLDFDTVYDYRVRAIASDGTPSDYSNVTTGTTAPAAPINLAVVSVSGSDSKLTLTWTDNAKHTTYFKLYRKGPGETQFTYKGYTYGSGGGNFTGTGTPGKGNTITATDTGLNVSSAYSYYVTAADDAGESDPSNTASGTTNTTQTPPAAPRLGGSAGSTGADGTANPKTTIRAYFYDESTNETSFTLQRINNDDPSSAYTTLKTSPGSPGTGTFYDYYDTGLAVDTSYSYRAYASNIKGDSPYSNILTAATVPIAPINLSVATVSGSDSQLTLTWTDNAKHTSYFKLYRKGPGETKFTYVGYTYGSGGGNFTGTGTPGKGNNITATDTGLTVNSAYSYYVTAADDAGESDPSNTATGTTNTTQTPPAAPRLGGSAGSTGADGTANPKTTIRAYFYDESTNETSFTLQRINNDDPSSAYTTLKTSPGSPGTGTFYDYYDTGLAVDTSYSYRAFASNSAGNSDYSNILTAATVPVKPINLSVASVSGSDSQLTLTWTDNAKHTSYFKLYRKGPGETKFTYVGYTYGSGGGNFTGTGSPGKGNNITATDTGLNVSSAYSYYVTAADDAGESDPSNTATGTTNTTQTPPAAPRLGGSAGSTGADGTANPKTTIRAYFYDESTNGTSVTLQRINNDDPSSVYTDFPGYPKADTGGYGTFYDNYDTGLDLDTSYSYRAFASNSKGNSDYSNILTAATAPVKPISVQATPISDTKIRLSWTDNARHTTYFDIYRKGPGETTFTYHGYTYGSGGGNFTGAGTPGKGNTISITDTGLTVNSAYSYYVTAYNSAGESDPSDTATGTTFPSNPPGAPTDLRGAGAADSTQVNLNWLDNSTDEYGFIVERETEGTSTFTVLPGATAGAPTVGPQAGTGRVYYSDKTVADDTAYTYRVKATNPAGDSAYSNTITATTPPTAPSTLKATAVAGTNDSIKLTWTDHSKHEDGFTLYRKGPGDTTFHSAAIIPAVTGTGSTVTYTDSGLAASAAYSYYVTAYNGAGESAGSNTVTATSGTTLPTTVTITSPLNGAKFNAGTDIPVTVTATPATGTTIVSYTLITNTVSKTQSTGSFTLTGLAAGSYTLAAKAKDSAGNTASFPGITITVVNQPPSVTHALISPSTLPVGGGTVTVSATVIDVLGVQSVTAAIKRDSSTYATITLSKGASGNVYSGTFDPGANLDTSTHVFTASVTATNVPGLSTTVAATGSTTQAAAVNSPDPTITSLTPTSVSINTTGLTLTIHGTGFVAATKVNFGTLTGLVPLSNSISATQIKVAIPDSALTTARAVSVTVVNPAPGGGTSNAVTFTVVVPKPIAPTLQSALPGNGSVALTFTTVPNAATYTLKSATHAGGPYTSDVTGVTATAGASTVTATDPNQTNGVKKYYVVSAVGPGGESPNSNELSATPESVNVPPTVILTSPANGATLTAPATVTLTATASDSDGAITKVEFFQNGVSVGSVTSAPYTQSVTNLAVGTYTFKAVATDNRGASTTSSEATVTVTHPALGVTILSGPADQSTVCASTVVFTWIGYSDTTPAAQLRYEYQVDGGPWSAPTTSTTHTLSGLTEGLHSFAVRLLNADGSIVGSPVGRSFFVSLTPPALLAATVDARDTRAIVSWSTSKPTTGYIEFGKTTSYGISSDPITVADGAHQTTLAGLTTQTTYHYRIHFTDGCHDVVSPDHVFTTQALLKPNLSITGATLPGSFAPLDTINVSWTVLDSGPGDALNNWTDSVYLSTDTTLDASDVKLGDVAVTGPILAFSNYSQSLSLAVPRVPAGQYYLIFKTDTANVINETNETDNTLALPVEVTALQDLIVTPDQTNLSLKTGQTVTGQLTLTDLSVGTLSGITATVSGAPANLTVNVTPPTSLLSLQSKTASYSVTAADASVLTGTAQIVFQSTSGAKATATLNLRVIPPTPVLVATPLTLSTSMVRGGQRLVDFTVTNTGDATAKNLKLNLPNAPWLSATTTQLHGDLAPGAVGTFELALTPAATLPLGLYSGSVGIKGDNAGLSIPFGFDCISTNKGGLKVVAQDEFSFFADTHPNIAGAHIVLTDATTGAVVLDDVTGPDGILTRPAVTEGDYNVEATAAGHKPSHSTLHLIAGQVNEIDPFLSKQLVTYTWTVVPIPFTDQYTVTLEAVFETHVPAPVVTVDPAFLNIRNLHYDSSGKAVVNYTITNHGLIAANNTKIKTPSDSIYTITPFVTNIGTIAPLSSVIVPVTITRKAGNAPHLAKRDTKNSTHLPGTPAAHVAQAMRPLDGAATICTLGGDVDFTYDCGGPRFTSDELIFDFDEDNCSDVDAIYTSTDDSSGGGGGGGGDNGGDNGGGDTNGDGTSVDGPPGISTDNGCFTPNDDGGGGGGGGTGGGGGSLGICSIQLKSVHLQQLGTVMGSVTLTGSGFVTGSTVEIGGWAAQVLGTSPTQITAQFPSQISFTFAQTLNIQVTNPGGAKSNVAKFYIFDTPFDPQLQISTSDGVIGHPIKNSSGTITRLAVDFTLVNTGTLGAFNVDIGLAQLTSKSASTTTTALNLFTVPGNGKRKIRLVFPYDPTDTSPTLGFSIGTDFPPGGINVAFQPITLGSLLTGAPGDGIPAECNAGE